MGVGSGPPRGVSFDTFKQWTRTCGVRKVQAKYEELAETARSNGRTIGEEMKQQGYNDYAAFAKTCPEFSVTCWPMEFAELGSGFVLYFHFLAALGFLFVLLFLLQVPAMSRYSQVDWREGWNFNEWNWAYTVRGCDCLGSNNGIQGPLPGNSNASVIAAVNADYGKSCGAWDMPYCTNESTCEFQSPAKWVCQNWCFVASHCGTAPDEDSPSMTDRQYRGLVKSYSSCSQDEALVSQCTGFRGGDSIFAEPGVVRDSTSYIATQWLTPGNTGPDSEESALIPTFYTICVCVICLVVFVQFQHMVMTNRRVDRDTTSPNDFAALVRGLPATATDGKKIAEFFRENAIAGRNDVEIVKVVIGWDAQEYTDKIRELKDLQAEKQTLEDKDPRIQEIDKRVKEIRGELLSTATEKASRLRSSGVVVVIFRYQSDLRAALARWTHFWAVWFNCDAQDTCILPKGNKLWKSTPLPRFPIGDPPRPVHKIQVERAPNPGDINWTELGIPWEKRMKVFMKTNGIMALLILVSFGMCYGLNKLQEHLKNSGIESGADALALLPALGVGAMNGVLSMAARKLGQKEYHDTKSVEEFSQALKMSIGMIVNTALVMLLINAQPQEWYQHGGLATDAFTMLIINAFIPHIMPYLDPLYRFKKNTRRQLTQEKLNYMNQVGSKKPTTDEEKQELAKVRADIEKFKKAYAPSPMNETRRYAVAIKTSVCCLFYMPVMPWIALVGALGIFLQYWVDKYLLLRWYHRPQKPASNAMAMFSLRFIKYIAPLGVTLAMWLFITPSWERKQVVYSNFTICILVSLAFSFCLPLSIWTKGFFALFGGDIVRDGEQDYYNAQYMWSTEMKYHKDHFMLKKLDDKVNPEILKPGEDAEPSEEVIKTSYGAATVAAGEDKDSHTTLKGGKVMSTMGASTSTTTVDKPSEAPSPTTYGAAVVPVAPPAAAEVKDEAGRVGGVGIRAAAEVKDETRPLVAETPPAASVGAPAAASTKTAASASSKPPEQVTWEFEGGHGGWHRFDNDCHDFIEKQYQKWQAGKGKEQVEVKTGDKKLSLDFKKMTQKLVGSHGIRNVRRRTS